MWQILVLEQYISLNRFAYGSFTHTYILRSAFGWLKLMEQTFRAVLRHFGHRLSLSFEFNWKKIRIKKNSFTRIWLNWAFLDLAYNGTRCELCKAHRALISSKRWNHLGVSTNIYSEPTVRTTPPIFKKGYSCCENRCIVFRKLSGVLRTFYFPVGTVPITRKS